MKRLRVLSVASEIFPLIKTGGLADVAGALPGALVATGVQMATLVPGYPAIRDALERRKTVARIADLMGGEASVVGGQAAGLDLLMLEAPHLYARPGNPYVDEYGRDWGDNAQRFAALAMVAAAIGRGLVPRYRPDVIHAHDWQAALVPAYRHYAGVGPPSMLTIHNLAFQGSFDPRLLSRLGLPDHAMSIDGVEYYGAIGFLKAGIAFADRITTVSPTYAAEIASPGGGMGLDGLLAARRDRLDGILNGIDFAVWDPAADPYLARPFSAGKLDARAANKAALLESFGLDPDLRAPLFGVVSRLTGQKGLDLLLETLPGLLASGGRLAVIGTGEPALEAGFRAAAETNPGRVAVLTGYDEARAHLMQAGADVILVPSRFEPCGLTQLCALRYGAVPLVARVGGLADTVIDANPAALAAGVATGIQFAPVEANALAIAIARAIALYRDPPIWRRIQANAMAADVSWAYPAAAYAALYRGLAARARRPGEA